MSTFDAGAFEFCGQTVPLLVGREARPLMGWRARPSGREHWIH
ncbi:hypothetical protein ACFWR9_07245 [Streptomyces sp. NPDC058534]